MSFGKKITLRSGTEIPQIGLGTWLSKPNEVENAVSIFLGRAQSEIARDIVGRWG